MIPGELASKTGPQILPAGSSASDGNPVCRHAGNYLVDLLLPQTNLISLLSLDRERIFQGEVWRLVTFIFLPPSSSPLWIVFALYFNCLIGEGLENQWGKFKFNLFYLCGMVGAILASLITGYGTNGISESFPFPGVCRFLSGFSGALVFPAAGENQISGFSGYSLLFVFPGLRHFCFLHGTSPVAAQCLAFLRQRSFPPSEAAVGVLENPPQLP